MTTQIEPRIDKSLEPTLKSSGYYWDDRGFWRNDSKPGVYISDVDTLTALLSKQKEASASMDSSSYDTGIDYSAAIDPYLDTASDTLSSLTSSGVEATDTTNEYETKLKALLDDPSSIADTGAYQFALGQGQQALERSQAAKGMSASGNTLAELLKYGQGMASQQYDTEADRLSDLSGQQQDYILGQRSANTADYSAKTTAANTGLEAGQLALKAAEDESSDYWNAKKSARQATQDTGYYTQNIW